jgi:hypothetical protein
MTFVEPRSPRISAIRSAIRWHRPLMWFAMAMIVTAVVSTVAYNLDDRVLVGAPIWAKPLKFSISFALYAVTLAWLISRLQRPPVRRRAQRTGAVLAVASGLEMAAIVMQVVRGTQSHFNYSTPFDSAVFATMGVLVVVIFVATIIVGIAFLRESPVADRATTWAVRLGIGISVAGMAVGFLMLRPTSAQLAQSQAPIRGAHSVGVPDGGPSIPLLGWSTTGGDLRIPHFIGLHGLQAMPLLALALAVAPATARFAEQVRVRLVIIGAAGYTALFALALWQALRGQSITAPDRWTTGAAVAIIAAVGAGAAFALHTGRRQRPDVSDDKGPDRTTEAAAASPGRLARLSRGSA